MNERVLDQLQALGLRGWRPTLFLLAASASLSALILDIASRRLTTWTLSTAAIALLLILLSRRPRVIVAINRLILGDTRRASFAATSVFRGLLPFSESEPAPGRGTESAACSRLIENSRFFILEGESGCGKTSLIRSHLLPWARARFQTEVLSVKEFVEQPWEQRQGAGPRLIVVDQFEELFSGYRRQIRLRAMKTLRKTLLGDPGVSIVLGIRNDFRDLLDQICRQVDPPQQCLAVANYYSLRPFLQGECANVIAELLAPLHTGDDELAAVHRDFAEALSEQLLEPPRDARLSREDDPTVLPAVLQAVGATLESIGGPAAFTRSYLTKLGGRLGVLGRFIEDVKRRVFSRSGASPALTLAVLRELASVDAMERGRSAADIAAAIRRSSTLVVSIVEALKDLRVVVNLPAKHEGELCFRLVHQQMLRVLEQAPEPRLRKMMDDRERLHFWTQRHIAMRNIDGVHRSRWHHVARYCFGNAMPIGEAVRLGRYATNAASLQAIHEAFRGFIVRACLLTALVSVAMPPILQRVRKEWSMNLVETATPGVALSHIHNLVVNGNLKSADLVGAVTRRGRTNTLALITLGPSQLPPGIRDKSVLVLYSVLTSNSTALGMLDYELIGALAASLDYYPCRTTASRPQCSAARRELIHHIRKKQPFPVHLDLRWRLIPGGSFVLGDKSGAGRSDEHPPHQVTIETVRMMAREVTNAQFRIFWPGFHSTEEDLMPVSGVSWYLAYAFSVWAGGRLPTEAEWERAAKANCATEWCDHLGAPVAQTHVAWTAPASKRRAHAVGQLQPNVYGLYDMAGNVWEWTADWYDSYTALPEAQPWGPDQGEGKVIRGGSYWNTANDHDTRQEVHGRRLAHT